MNTDDHNDFDDDLRNRMQNLESQMADILGELDQIAKDDPEQRAKTLGMKLRHMELQRHHLAALELEEDTKYRQIQAVETICEAAEVWLKKQAEIKHAPGHTVLSLRALGMRIEASGKEDDPLFQHIARTVEELSVKTAKIREETIKRDLDERERTEEHCRDLDLINAVDAGKNSSSD